MARIRSAKPDFWTDPVMCALSRDVRFTYKGLWEVCADDHGRFMADSRVVKGAVWPMDDDITTRKVENWLRILEENGRIQMYVVGGVRYGYIPTWHKHQRVSHPAASRFPEPPPESLRNPSGATPEALRKSSVLSGAERRGEELERSGAESNGGPPAPLAELPRHAQQLLAMFYEPALTDQQRERYRDVQRQLQDTLRPGVPGPKIRGGIRVKARSVQHLDDACAHVCADPPNDRDLAIVIVLKILTNPPKGPTPAEEAATREADDRAIEEAYHADRRHACIAWAKEHPEEYETIRAHVAAEFRDSQGSLVGRMASDAALTQRCARAMGFPDFTEWLETHSQPAESL